MKALRYYLYSRLRIGTGLAFGFVYREAAGGQVMGLDTIQDSVLSCWFMIAS